MSNVGSNNPVKSPPAVLPPANGGGGARQHLSAEKIDDAEARVKLELGEIIGGLRRVKEATVRLPSAPPAEDVEAVHHQLDEALQAIMPIMGTEERSLVQDALNALKSLAGNAGKGATAVAGDYFCHSWMTGAAMEDVLELMSWSVDDVRNKIHEVFKTPTEALADDIVKNFYAGLSVLTRAHDIAGAMDAVRHGMATLMEPVNGSAKRMRSIVFKIIEIARMIREGRSLRAVFDEAKADATTKNGTAIAFSSDADVAAQASDVLLGGARLISEEGLDHFELHLLSAERPREGDVRAMYNLFPAQAFSLFWYCSALSEGTLLEPVKVEDEIPTAGEAASNDDPQADLYNGLSAIMFSDAELMRIANEDADVMVAFLDAMVEGGRMTEQFLTLSLSDQRDVLKAKLKKYMQQLAEGPGEHAPWRTNEYHARALSAICENLSRISGVMVQKRHLSNGERNEGLRNGHVILYLRDVHVSRATNSGLRSKIDDLISSLNKNKGKTFNPKKYGPQLFEIMQHYLWLDDQR